MTIDLKSFRNEFFFFIPQFIRGKNESNPLFFTLSFWF